MFDEIDNNRVQVEAYLPQELLDLENENRRMHNEAIEKNLQVLKNACPPDEYDMHVTVLRDVGGRTYYLFDGKIVFWSETIVDREKITHIVQPWLEEDY